MASDNLIEQARKVLMNTYSQQPVVFHKGRGTRLYDPEGREYLDFVGGVAVNNLGHCHPNVTVAFQKQAQRLVHVSNLYYSEPSIRLAKLLVEKCFADRVFFCNSGTESWEAALKFSRKWGYKTFPDRPKSKFIAMTHSFHGRAFYRRPDGF